MDITKTRLSTLLKHSHYQITSTATLNLFIVLVKQIKCAKHKHLFPSVDLLVTTDMLSDDLANIFFHEIQQDFLQSYAGIFCLLHTWMMILHKKCVNDNWMITVSEGMQTLMTTSSH